MGRWPTQARDVMVKPVVTLNECASVHTLLDTLSSSKHNGFPVVKRGENGQASFIGLVLRSQV
jgi:CBS domain-containing protein